MYMVTSKNSLVDHVEHDVEPDSATRNFGDLFAGREARGEDGAKNLRFAGGAGDRGIQQADGERPSAHGRHIDATSIVGNAKVKALPDHARGDANGGLGRLSGLHALLGWLDPVVDGIAQKVQEGHFEES